MIDVFLTKPVKGKPSNKKIEKHENVGKGKIVKKMGKIPHFYCFPFPIRKCLIAYFEIREFMHYE